MRLKFAKLVTRLWIPWAVLGLGLVISLFAFYILKAPVEAEARLRFENDTGDIGAAIQARVWSYYDVLYGVQGLFSASGTVTRASFQKYFSNLNLAARYPGFQVLSFARGVEGQRLVVQPKHLMKDIQKIVAKLPKQRQTLLFSATMPADIRQLADKILSNPVRVHIESKNAAADLVEQSVYFVDKRNKPALLKHLIEQGAVTRALVFTRTKHGADKVAKHLARCGIRAEAIHGDKTQSARQRALVNFKSSKPPILVATDVAARGLDIDEVSHVVNYDMPNVPETYVHRIGRTGRAGAAGIAVSFCDHDEREHLRDIEKLLRKKTTVRTDHPEYAAPKEPAPVGNRSKSDRPSAPPQRKPHAAGPADDRHRSRRRKFNTASKAAPQGYSTMW